MRTHEFKQLQGTALDSCEHKEPVIEGYAAQCCESKGADIHKPPFGKKVNVTVPQNVASYRA
jgi:hypothetical protein